MSTDFKWSEVPQRERWVVAWGVIWRWVIGYMTVLAGVFVLVLMIAAAVN